MTRPIERPELDDVLDAYVAEVETPSRATLAEWIQRYPYYERELTEFTVAWCEMQSLSPAEGTEPDEDDEALLQYGMNIVQSIGGSKMSADYYWGIIDELDSLPELLTDWEADFLENLLSHRERKLTPKQVSVVERMKERYLQ